jgi:hypothetical protein
MNSGLESNLSIVKLLNQKNQLNIDNKQMQQIINSKMTESKILNEKQNIYKPPNRSNSSNKPVKSLNIDESETTYTSTSPSRVSETETYRNNGKSYYDRRYEEMNGHMKNIDLNKKDEHKFNACYNQNVQSHFTTSTHKSNSVRSNFNIEQSLEKNASSLGFNQNKVYDRSGGMGNKYPPRVIGSNQGLNSLNNLKDYNQGVSRSSTPISNNKKSTQSQCYIINLEDLMLLEEKLSEIINNFNNSRPAINECFDWWNFYFNCSLCGKLEFYFRDEENKAIIHDYIILELFALIICYDSSHNKELLANVLVMLNSILGLIHHNFLILCEYILSKISSESKENIWVSKLRDLTEDKMSMHSSDNINYYGKKVSVYTSEIKLNNNSIYDYIRIVLKNYPKKSEVCDILFKNFKTLGSLTLDGLNELFRSKIIRVINKNASVLASSLIGIHEDNFEQIAVPYLNKKSLKEYTLVLDLDETLIHFKIDNNDDNKGLLRLRPGIFDFLDSMTCIYEIVIFTAATQEVIMY